MNGNILAYSTLPQILARRNTTVMDLHRRLAKKGFKMNIKSLYRLTQPKPILEVKLSILGEVCRELNTNLDELVSWGRPQPKLHRIDARQQKRLDELMDRNTQGILTVKERREFEKLAAWVEHLSLENARTLARGSRNRLKQQSRTKVRAAA